MRLKLAGAAVLALGALTATMGSAEARDGCGPGFHRGFYGWCRPNAVYRPIAYRPAYWGYRRVGWYGPRWHHRWGWRHHAWHRPWGWGGYRHVGWRHHGWHGGWGHHGWHHRW